MKDQDLIDKIKAREIVSEIMQFGVNLEVDDKPQITL